MKVPVVQQVVSGAVVMPPLPPISMPVVEQPEPQETKLEQPKKHIPTLVKEQVSVKTDNPLYKHLYVDSGSPQVMDISWFDLDKLLESINVEINKISRGWWKALTVNGDMVLVLTTFVWQVVKMQADKAGEKDIAAIDNNDQDNDVKKSVLMSVVQVLWDSNYIHTNWIKKGYYNAKFVLLDKNGNECGDGWYIPFRVDAFSCFNTYDDYEVRKQEKLLDIVSAKVPDKK